MTTLLCLILVSFRTIPVPSTTIDGKQYVKEVDLVRALSLKKISQGAYSGRHTRLTISNGKIGVGDKKFQVKIKKVKGKLYFEAEDLEPVIGKILKKNIYWDREKSRYIVSKYPPSVKDIRLKAVADSTLILIKHNMDLRVRVSRESDFLFLVSVDRGFYRGPKNLTLPHTLKGIDIFHISKGLRIKVWLRQRSDVSVIKGDGKTLLRFTPIRLEKNGTRKGLVIVIDPGHGGKDPGAIGRYGTKEKTINLQVAKKLKKILEDELGAKVILTRNHDVFVPLRERSRLANRVGANMFISLHCNYERKRRTRGVETYFLSVARTKWERAVENLENGALKYETKGNTEPIDVVKYVLSDMAQAQFLKESQTLAMYVQENLSGLLKQHNRGVKQAGFYVLVGTYMPAILVEMGFISHPSEERRLKTSKYQWKIARGIAAGIKQFLQNRNKQLSFGGNF